MMNSNKKNNKEKGNLGEKIAGEYLKNSGYIILEKNFRIRGGEIDIICKDKECIVFVEVKTRYSTLYGSPGEAVDLHKQHKISQAAQVYIMKNKLLNCYFRFDVVEIILKDNDEVRSINLVKNAFAFSR